MKNLQRMDGFNDTRREKLCFTQFSTSFVSWLLDSIIDLKAKEIEK